MSPNLDHTLCERYPRILVNRHPIPQTPAMCWGFECGDGWFNILDQLFKIIQQHIDLKAKAGKEVTQVVAVQVKEKFGGLRFYYDGGDEKIFGMVRMAEAMSYKTCETCGNPGELKNEGWMKVCCPAHWD